MEDQAINRGSHLAVLAMLATGCGGGDSSMSVLWERLRRLGADRMPPLGSHEIDPLAVDILGRWIDGL